MSFATDYRPGHRIMLADRSASAAYLAAAAPREWPNFSGADTPPAFPQAELPAPARQDYLDYFGGGPTVTSIAE